MLDSQETLVYDGNVNKHVALQLLGGKPVKLSKIKHQKLEPMEKKTTKTVVSSTTKEVSQLIEEKFNLDAQIKILEERKSQITERVKSLAEQLGAQDVKGSFNYVVKLEDKNYVISKQARSSVSLNKDALKAYIKKHLRKEYDKVVHLEEVEVIDDKYVEQLIILGKIPTGDIEQFRDVKITYAGVLKELKEGEEFNFQPKEEKPSTVTKKGLPKVVVNNEPTKNRRLIRR
jgi:hypothetical protein